MAGVFNIHRRRAASITGAMSDNPGTASYILIRYDFNVGERESVAFSEANIPGSISNPEVDIELSILVVGNTEALVVNNIRDLNRALRDDHGGWIEFRPREYPSTYMTTFYHYTKLVEHEVVSVSKTPDMNGLLGYEVRYVLTIKTWATSDPRSPATITTPTIQNRGSHTNYLDIPSPNNFPGDVIFPIILIEGNYASVPTAEIDELIIQKRTASVGDLLSTAELDTLNLARYASNGYDNDLDFIEAERALFNTLSPPPGVLEVDDTTSSGQSGPGGQYVRLSDTTEIGEDLQLSFPDFQYVGPLVPMFMARQTSTSIWEVNVNLVVSDGTNESVIITSTTRVSATKWEIHIGQELVYPFHEVPDRFSWPWFADDQPGDFLSRTTLRIDTERISGSGNLELDFFWLARSDEFLARMLPPITGTGTGISSNGNRVLEINSYEETLFLRSSIESDIFIAPWAWQGQPLSRLAIEGFRDTRIAVLGASNSAANGYYGDWEYTINVLGLHGTIYPFLEAE